jgi:hypothetical protein
MSLRSRHASETPHANAAFLQVLVPECTGVVQSGYQKSKGRAMIRAG